MCQQCGTGNDVLKARKLKLKTWSAEHQSWCATRHGHACDCDPKITPIKQLSLFGS
jgi:hypothetical protein